MNWYIGQKVVAVKDHSKGDFKRGQQFEIKGIKSNPCPCCKYIIDIGLTYNDMHGMMMCKMCSYRAPITSLTAWYSEHCFAPIEPKQELSEHTTETLIEELEEQLQPC